MVLSFRTNPASGHTLAQPSLYQALFVDARRFHDTRANMSDTSLHSKRAGHKSSPEDTRQVLGDFPGLRHLGHQPQRHVNIPCSGGIYAH